ncbi:Lysoplasmalogenase [Bagarius yarrelli]|uniref:lysoplasmalogenase n=1 Tax=Bagarius yarrelli TaxID=175774 RepID=A0A556VCK0_BAGYA|nr:Lysoplasmalogenase [Bagarius yarrelli]
MDILDTDAYDKRQRRNTSCMLFLFLLPFFASVALYFYLWIPDSAPSILASGVKAAPVLSLAFVVLKYNGGRSLLGVAGGLVMSAGGDACLIWPNLFLMGMIFFALAHMLYSLTFLTSRYFSHSLSSCGLYFFYLLLWAAGGGIYFYLLPFLKKSPEPEVFVPAVGGYALLIVLMTSLAARTRRPLVLLGGLVFMVSDFTLALQQFKVVEHLEHGKHLVMTTYYLAQLLIAVGDIKATMAEQAEELHKWKRS